jgi:hypothetical protein
MDHMWTNQDQSPQEAADDIAEALRDADAKHKTMMEALERLNEIEASESSFATEEAWVAAVEEADRAYGEASEEHDEADRHFTARLDYWNDDSDVDPNDEED